MTGTGLARAFDASTPPASTPPNCSAVLGYIGRPAHTPHVWTPAEWQRFKSLVQLPCWVPDLTQHASVEAIAILAALKEAGWPSGGASLAPAVIIDYETAGMTEAEWHAELADVLGHGGINTVAYGSLSTIMQVAAAHVWVADWDGTQQLDPAGQTVMAHQYAADIPYDGTKVDYSVVTQWLIARGLRRV